MHYDGIPRNAKLIRITLRQVKATGSLSFRSRVNGSDITSAAYNNVFHYGFDTNDADAGHDTNTGGQNTTFLCVIGNWGSTVFHSGFIEMVRVADFQYSGYGVFQHFGYNEGGGMAIHGCLAVLAAPMDGVSVIDSNAVLL